ncbi:GNAT family N-acetyltransferase [Afifella sp. IM 167]|uniref:GNAT family N-acetyltransferase n=1 Tax=Afifella sp. IM 167 TaxID=2033586 RepID=UPI001CC9DFBA|nr:GNAT family N-acetyltransferase [Afifella sp. IM 167]MBZ8133371.1 GNAT family N-acetyltransferase [Afifella sp. IM 167]
MKLEPPFRRATPDDAAAMAELVNMAGEGLPVYLWSGMAAEGEDVWALGRQRAQREEGSFSYRNTVVAEAGGKVAACLIGYPLAAEPEPIGPDMPAMFVPLQELENLAPATWYVNVLAAYPEHRGKGLGRGLLAIADAIAAEAGLSGLSIIVSDANHGARRLYESCGYAEIAMRPMVKEGWENGGENWVLLVKRL